MKWMQMNEMNAVSVVSAVSAVSAGTKIYQNIPKYLYHRYQQI
jgi:hypothetical protein